MARYDHLRLVRLPERLERRKRSFGSVVPRDRGPHSTRLRSELDAAVESQQRRRRPHVITPSLILRVRMMTTIPEEEWNRLGLTVLSVDADRTLILFSSSDEMHDFRNRLDAYGSEVPEGQKNPPYATFVSAIESIGSVEPRDRIGLRLRSEGFNDVGDFTDDAEHLLDVELWDEGERILREAKLSQISVFAQASGAEVLGQYVGPSITMLRLRARGALVRDLLTVEDVASLDNPPEPDLATGLALELTLSESPELSPLDEDSPVIGVIDSGVNAHPLIEDIVVGAIAVPESLGTVDDYGHGTRVAGVAVFGDLREQLGAGTLFRSARICSAKVLNERGEFDERSVVPSQMRRAITSLHERFGCRIFVVALGDRKMPYAGTKVGAWAATLDELVRELDIVIVVSAGNRNPRAGELLEEAVTEYPHYLAESDNRFFEPAGAVNVITVGALAHGEGIDTQLGHEVSVRAIAKRFEPSPFTRVGPGHGGAVKPDVVDLGGTLVFDPVVRELRRGENYPSAGLLTLHHRPVDHLFTSGSGTSYAAPLVASKASHILRLFPHASANLVRALLIGAAEVPAEARERLQALDEVKTRVICGHGQVDLERAAYSDDARVVLYAEDELPLDYFAVYEVPIPEPFQSEAGRRTVRITLAFDPQVRHTRADYQGTTMSFRLLRGCAPELIFDHYRKRSKDDGPFPEIAKRFQCSLEPGPKLREKGTLQTACAEFKRDIADYGDRYYLVVRCESGWAANLPVHQQRFSVVVELAHQAEVQLYERIRVRLSA